MQSNDPTEDLKERINLKQASTCQVCGVEECTCSDLPQDSVRQASVTPNESTQSSTAAVIVPSTEPDSLQLQMQPLCENRVEEGTTRKQTNIEPEVRFLAHRISSHSFRNVLSICVLEFLEDQTLCGATIAFASILLSLASTITNNDYDKIGALVNPTFRWMAVFLISRQVICWFLRRSRLPDSRKPSIAEIAKSAARRISVSVMTTLVFASIILAMILWAIPAQNQFVWTFNGSPLATPLFLMTALSILAVLVQETWMFFRGPSAHSEVKAPWITRVKTHAKTFVEVARASRAAMLTIFGLLMLLCWPDLMWFSGAAVVAQSLQANDLTTATKWAETLQSTGRAHAAETKYLMAISSVAAGKETEAERQLDQALSALQNSNHSQQLMADILSARSELALRPQSNTKQKAAQGANSGLEKSYDLIYGPFRLNIQIPKSAQEQTNN